MIMLSPCSVDSFVYHHLGICPQIGSRRFFVVEPSNVCASRLTKLPLCASLIAPADGHVDAELSTLLIVRRTSPGIGSPLPSRLECLARLPVPGRPRSAAHVIWGDAHPEAKRLASARRDGAPAALACRRARGTRRDRSPALRAVAIPRPPAVAPRPR